MKQANYLVRCLADEGDGGHDGALLECALHEHERATKLLALMQPCRCGEELLLWKRDRTPEPETEADDVTASIVDGDPPLVRLVRRLVVTARQQPDIEQISAVPKCALEECRQYDGKRCRLLGYRPSEICAPAVEILVKQLMAEESTR